MDRPDRQEIDAEFEAAVAKLIADGTAQCGLKPGMQLYEGALRAHTDPHLHDFRLKELPALTGDPGILVRRLKVLDLGCGPGIFVYRALEGGHDAYGIDLDEKKVQLGGLWARKYGYPEEWAGRLAVADATDLPFENETFDLVSSYQVLEHVTDLSSVLYEAVRVTKRGGWLDLRAPDYRQSMDNHYGMPWPRFMPRKQALRWAEAMGRPIDYVGGFFSITLPQVRAIVEALNCTIVSATLWHHLPGGPPRVFDGSLMVDPIIFKSDADIAPIANELQALASAGRLPSGYSAPLEFTLIARRR